MNTSNNYKRRVIYSSFPICNNANIIVPTIAPKKKPNQNIFYTPFSNNFFHVFIPQIPSTVSPFAFWYSLTFSSVLVPKIMSAFPRLYPSIFNLYCIIPTYIFLFPFFSFPLNGIFTVPNVSLVPTLFAWYLLVLVSIWTKVGYFIIPFSPQSIEKIAHFINWC